MKESTLSLIFTLLIGITFIPAAGVALRDMAVSMEAFEKAFATPTVATNTTAGTEAKGACQLRIECPAPIRSIRSILPWLNGRF